MAGQIISNQIYKIQTSKKLIASFDKLNAAPISCYASIHASGEEENGRRLYSLIGIEIQDYSNGTGNNNIIARFNLAPEYIQFLLTRVELGYQDYEDSIDKIFGEPDRNGLSKAQKFSISRHPTDRSGQYMLRPWFISISNGRGVKAKNANGGFYMKKGSYKPETNASINLTDAEFYALLKRTSSYISVWEVMAALENIQKGREAFTRQADAARANAARQGGYQQDYQDYRQDYSQDYSHDYSQYANAGVQGYRDYRQDYSQDYSQYARSSQQQGGCQAYDQGYPQYANTGSQEWQQGGQQGYPQYADNGQQGYYYG